MRRRDPKHGLYAFRITYADLNMRFGVESGAIENWAAFKKYAADGINGHFFFISSDVVEKPHYGAIQGTSQLIGSISRKLISGVRCQFQEFLMGNANVLHANRCRHIKAKPQLNNGAHDSRRLNFDATLQSFAFFGEFQAARRVCLPEIDSGP